MCFPHRPGLQSYFGMTWESVTGGARLAIYGQSLVQNPRPTKSAWLVSDQRTLPQSQSHQGCSLKPLFISPTLLAVTTLTQHRPLQSLILGAHTGVFTPTSPVGVKICWQPTAASEATPTHTNLFLCCKSSCHLFIRLCM